MREQTPPVCWRCLIAAMTPLALFAGLGWWASNLVAEHRTAQSYEAEAMIEQLDDLAIQNQDLRDALGARDRAVEDARALARAADEWTFRDLIDRVLALPQEERKELLERMGVIEQGALSPDVWSPELQTPALRGDGPVLAGQMKRGQRAQTALREQLALSERARQSELRRRIALEAEVAALRTENQRLRRVSGAKQVAAIATITTPAPKPAAAEGLREDLEAAQAALKAVTARLAQLDGGASPSPAGLRQRIGAALKASGADLADGALRLSSALAFKSGSAELSAMGRARLDRVVDEISAELQARPRGDWTLVVEGHTDHRPIATAAFPSNWELSAARAASVARYLGDRGVPEQRILAVGRAAHEPVLHGDDAIALAANRRIEFEIAFN